MASRIARNFLRSQGIDILRKPHTALELSNYSVGTGQGRYAMPYQVIRMRDTTGDSKETVGHSVSIQDARKQANAMQDAHGIENERHSYTYYIRDIRDGTIYGA